MNKPKHLYTYRTQNGVEYGLLTKTIMDFESLCFSMYKADGGVKVSELQRMNVIEFYTHKTNLTEYLKKTRTKERE